MRPKDLNRETREQLLRKSRPPRIPPQVPRPTEPNTQPVDTDYVEDPAMKRALLALLLALGGCTHATAYPPPNVSQTVAARQFHSCQTQAYIAGGGGNPFAARDAQLSCLEALGWEVR